MADFREFNTNMIIQYSLVGLALLAAFAWILWKSLKKEKKIGSSCCGCSLAENCNKKTLLNKDLKDNHHGNSTNLRQQHCGESDQSDC